MSLAPVVILEKCNGCGLCVSVCRCSALVIVNNLVNVLEVDDCGWCTQCEAVCPTGAISCPFEIIIEEP